MQVRLAGGVGVKIRRVRAGGWYGVVYSIGVRVLLPLGKNSFELSWTQVGVRVC